MHSAITLYFHIHSILHGFPDGAGQAQDASLSYATPTDLFGSLIRQIRAGGAEGAKNANFRVSVPTLLLEIIRWLWLLIQRSWYLDI